MSPPDRRCGRPQFRTPSDRQRWRESEVLRQTLSLPCIEASDCSFPECVRNAQTCRTATGSAGCIEGIPLADWAASGKPPKLVVQLPQIGTGSIVELFAGFGCFGTRSHVQFGQNRGDMVFHGSGGEKELTRYL